jgi:hypothetical protein
MMVAAVFVREVGVVDGTVVPIVGMPLWEDVVSVVAVDMQGWAMVAPVPNS